MADLDLYYHPLVMFGPTGEDDDGREWLNGERPIYRTEEAAHLVQWGERRQQLIQKDDWIGFLSDESNGGEAGWEGEENSPERLLKNSFFFKSSLPDVFDVPPGKLWRKSVFYPASFSSSLSENSQLGEAMKVDLPLTLVDQYDAGIFSRKRYPQIGQEIDIGEDPRLLPQRLRQLDMAGMLKLFQSMSTHEAELPGSIELRWKMAKKGRSGFGLYLRHLKNRRAACRRFFPALHNLDWYLSSTEEWLKLRGVWIRGTCAVSGLQLLLYSLWGVGYALHQGQAGSWWRRALHAGRERILHMGLKCQHTHVTEQEGEEIATCVDCSKIKRIFEMGFVDTAYFLRYVEPHLAPDIFGHIYQPACEAFYGQIYKLMSHLSNCSRGCSEITTNSTDAVLEACHPCFTDHDDEVRDADMRLSAMARKRLASHTEYQREHLLSEGCLAEAKYENESPSLDVRDEHCSFDYDINW